MSVRAARDPCLQSATNACAIRNHICLGILRNVSWHCGSALQLSGVSEAIFGTSATGTCTPKGPGPIHLIAAQPHEDKKGTHMKVTVNRAGGMLLLFAGVARGQHRRAGHSRRERLQELT